MLELAIAQPHSFVPLSAIAKKFHVSEKYLSQLVLLLKQVGLVKSKEGKSGGYCLARRPDQISLLDVVSALNGPMQLTRCLEKSGNCPAKKRCPVNPIWAALQMDINVLLAKKTLAGYSC